MAVTLNVSLEEEQKGWLNSRREAGGFSSVSDFFRALIREKQEQEQAQLLAQFKAMHVGRRQRNRTNEGVGFVHRHMRLVAIMRLTLFHRVTGVTVTTGGIALRGRAARGWQQRRVHQRAGFQNQALGLQLPVDHSQQLFVQAGFAQPLPEAHQGRFIRHGVLQAQANERRQLKRSLTSSSHCGSDKP